MPDETTTETLIAGVRLWSGAEAWVNPEIDQGFGLSNTVGIAGFSSGIAETFYSIGLFGGIIHLTADYEFIDNPGYNKDWGSVSILSSRLHAQF